jgi:signal transduction histidine kinase
VQKAYYTKLKKAYPNSMPVISRLQNDEVGNTFAQSGTQVYLLQDKAYASSAGSQGKFPFYWQSRTWIFKTGWLIQSNKGDIIDLRKAASADTSFRHSGLFSFDKSGRLIISGNSLYIVEKNLNVYATTLPYFTDNIVVDDENKYWAFSRSGNISSYALEGGVIRPKIGSIQINNFSPRFAIHWNTDTFCIGTRHQGILWLKINNGHVSETSRFNTSKGLSNNFVLGFVKKSNRQLLATTGFGLDEIIIKGADTIVQNLSATNNLYLPFGSVIQNNKGEIFAHSNDNQLWVVTDNENQRSAFIPAAWFNEITVNGKTIIDSIKTFMYNENNFRFAITAPCFTNASNVRFAFLLENESNKWQQQSTDNFYSINNLAPGNYILTVTIIYPGKIYPDKKIVYAFTINAPLWKRWWFIMLSILLAATIFWRSTRAYYKRKLAAQKAEAEKKQAVEKERNRISRDMHDDLGSGLTKIAILSEVAKKQLAEPGKAKEQLEKISISSRELVDNLQDIIWVLNPLNDTLESLAAYIREYALKYFEAQEVQMQFIYPEDFLKQPLSEEKRRNVFLTVKESLHNIAKHAWCNEVVISIGQLQHQFEISIKDDGKGFDPEQARQFANGLKNMQNRIEQVGGNFSLLSEPGKGTFTVINIPV